MRVAPRHIAIPSLFAAALLVPVGVMTAVFSGPYLAGLAGIDRPAFGMLLLIAVAIAHLLPVVLFYKACWHSAGPGLFRLMLVCAPLVGWPGALGLLVHGDWGDVALWGPDLATGICLLVCGLVGLSTGKR